MHIWQANKSDRRHRNDLSARLSAIADCLPTGGVVCDVGADHGALSLYLLQTGQCSRVIVTDLNSHPLARAEQNLTAAGVSDRAQFLLTDGIVEVLPYQPDGFVIAGMGGETILGILDRAKGKIAPGTVFVMQPMTREVPLRRYLYENGFCVKEEEVVLENGKVFLIFKAEFDGIPRLKEDDFFRFGEYLPNQDSAANRAYFETCLVQLESIIAGKQKAGQSVETERKQRAQCLARLEVSNEDS